MSREVHGLGEKRYEYDGAGRIVREETVSRNSGTYYTEYDYAEDGRTVTVTGGGAYTETLNLNGWGGV